MLANSPSILKSTERRAATQAAMDRADKVAILEHARLGFSIPEWDGEKVVKLSPAQIFARYGLDEFGRPNPTDTNTPGA